VIKAVWMKHFILVHRDTVGKNKPKYNSLQYITVKIYSLAKRDSDLGSNANTYNETDY